MKKIFLILAIVSAGFAGCKKQLDVKNPNQPTPDATSTEQGILSLAQGGVYINGFKTLKYGDGVFGLFWSGAMGFHELLGDVVGAEAANSFLNQIGAPDKVTYSTGSSLPNPNNPSKFYSFIRMVNQNDYQGSNFTYYEWAYMYNMIAACNSIMDIAPNVKFTGDGASKLAAINAWARFWKGFAYAHIGSIYYAGIINNTAFSTNSKFVSHDEIIAESNAQFDAAIAELGKVKSAGDYSSVIGSLIPSFCQKGKGQVPTTDMFVRGINTMKARNILVNKVTSSMTASDWNAVLALVNNGVKSTDYVFTGRTNTTGDFLPATSSTVSFKIQSSAAGGNTYKLSERWVQEFKAGDQRRANNIRQSANPWIGNSDRGNAFNTRFTLINGGAGLSNVYVFANTTPEAFELYLAGSYEENALMKAEALINLGQIDAGLKEVDDVRNSMGAGLAAVANTGLTAAQAKEELRRERRIALAFRGLSFYDARRNKVSEPASAGGGRTGAVVVDIAGKVDTNATIEYGYLDYWDVPDNELAYNPASADSAPVKNPKQ